MGGIMDKLYMKIRRIVSTVLFVLAFIPMYAQQGFTPIERKALDKALTVVEDYETLSALSDEDAYYSFIELFAGEDAIVYNDLLGLSGKTEITAKEYADILYENAKSVQIFVSDIKREKLWNDGSSWKVQFAFDKTIAYSNKCGIYFSSDDFYESKHHLHATIVYDSQKDECKIEGISGNIDSDRKLADEFYVLSRMKSYDDALRYKGRKVEFNRYGQMYLQAPVSVKDFSYLDADVTVSPTIDQDCKTVTMSYKPRRWAVKLHYDLGLGEAYDYEKSYFENPKSEGSTFGLEVGYIFPSKKKVKIGLFTGVDLSTAKLGMDYKTDAYSYKTNADVDNDTYQRVYNDLNISQKYSVTDLCIPLYLDFDIRFSRPLSLYFDLGARAVLNMSNKVKENSSNASSVFGIYDGYNLYGTSHINGFSDSPVELGKLNSQSLVGYSKFSVDALAGVGIRFNVPKVPVTVDLGVRYLYGIMNLLGDSNKKPVLKAGTDISEPIVYNTISGGSSVEYVRNLLEASGNMTRRQLSFNIGLIFKF